MLLLVLGVIDYKRYVIYGSKAQVGDVEVGFLDNRCIFWTASYDVGPGYGGARMRYERSHLGMIGWLGIRCWAQALSVGLFSVMEVYDVDLMLGVHA